MGRTPTSPSGSPNKKKAKAAAGLGPAVAKATDLDVLLGRGKGAYLSKGNQRLLQIVSLYLPAYMTANKNKEKIQITNEIVTEVKQGGGRFLCEDTSGRLYEAPDQKARIKVAQAIRHKRRLYEDEGGDAAAINGSNNLHGNSSNRLGVNKNNEDNNAKIPANNNMNIGGFHGIMDHTSPFASSSRLVGSHEEMLTSMQAMMGQPPPPQHPCATATIFPPPPTHLFHAGEALSDKKSRPITKVKQAPAAANNNSQSATRKAGGKAPDVDDDRHMLAGALLSLQAANATTFPEGAEPQEQDQTKEEDEALGEQADPSNPKDEEERQKKKGKNSSSSDEGTVDGVSRISNFAGPRISNFASL